MITAEISILMHEMADLVDHNQDTQALHQMIYALDECRMLRTMVDLVKSTHEREGYMSEANIQNRRKVKELAWPLITAARGEIVTRNFQRII